MVALLKNTGFLGGDAGAECGITKASEEVTLFAP
jgi:hypothetical protein